ncbi:hypothetical protein CERSUDRAFT_98474 [Gelatoporia subvermispora B]|uniref:Uncharacterized protein n=1 Tax=Ceriporiopsis subvermispora (strain B) TaxID=914234 RepID=M2PCF3_CERS8|nr:hypothetical protein CERSUDRAFT_98474 [Gelatoporia subvermispora B]
MLTDDLPWPELGNVSRGATRGNQGQKGFIGPPDAEGRCLLQLRVQPGVLAVLLNHQASDWYRTLDSEVNRALKLTKTYWRKARRRQDYDARADQDHMELHEWLQQLKDKVMSHLELLMQKGEIQGPPYIMPDNIELTFLRRFMERHAAGIPHNPRLRRGMVPRIASGTDPQHNPQQALATPPLPLPGWDAVPEKEDTICSSVSPGPSLTPADKAAELMKELDICRDLLKTAQGDLLLAQQETKEAFTKYTNCLETETKARRGVSTAQERRDAVVDALLQLVQQRDAAAIDRTLGQSPAGERPSSSSRPRSESGASTTQSNDEGMGSLVAFQDNSHTWKSMRDLQWAQADNMGTVDMTRDHHMNVQHDAFSVPSREHSVHMTALGGLDRKHPRAWDSLQVHRDFEHDVPLPPRKRLQMSGDFGAASRGLAAGDDQVAMGPRQQLSMHPNINQMPNGSAHTDMGSFSM